MCAADDRGQSGMPGNEYADGMIEHDGDVGKLLKALDDLGIADNTIVVYTTDNGPQPVLLAGRGDDAVPQREGHQLGRRVPRAGDDPLAGPHQGRRQSPTRCSPGSTGSRRCLRRPATPTSRTSCSRAPASAARPFKVHLDGYNQLPYLTGQQPKVRAQRTSTTSMTTASWSHSATTNWKVVFCEQREPGGFEVWSEPFTCLRAPKLFNLRMDPYERADITSNTTTTGDPARVPARPGSGLGGAVPRDLQGLPAPPEAFELQRRRGSGDNVEGTRRLTAATTRQPVDTPAGAMFVTLPSAAAAPPLSHACAAWHTARNKDWDGDALCGGSSSRRRRWCLRSRPRAPIRLRSSIRASRSS